MTLFLLCSLSLIFIVSVESVDDYYYPRYHLAPPGGWMNDPNGFCYFNGKYHLFYQYNPFSSLEPGIANWGHATSDDLVHWEHEPIAMMPDEKYDRDGVFSGSALIVNNTMYLFYTGNVNHKGETPDHEQHQALAISHDGVTVTKYEGNPIIEGKNRQPNFRDPKVWQHKDTYYMVLGNSYDNDTQGRVLLYSSKNMIDWEETSILDQSFGYLGYMWECPDFFELDGKWILLFSPQGVKRQGILYNNLYQTGYIVGFFDYLRLKFTPITGFIQLDAGHDFYATQTMKDMNNNRILVAWLDMWEQNYLEQKTGFTGQMTIPRVLTLNHDLRLTQKPVSQIHNAIEKLLYSGNARDDQTIELINNTALIQVTASGDENFNLVLEVEGKPFVTFTYDYEIGLVTLDRGGDDGKRSTKWRPRECLILEAYVDRSSIEIFLLEEGVVTFSSRIFPNGTIFLKVVKSYNIKEMSVFSMKQTMESPPSD